MNNKFIIRLLFLAITCTTNTIIIHAYNTDHLKLVKEFAQTPHDQRNLYEEKLHNLDLSYAEISGWDLSYGDFNSTDFTGATMKETNFYYTDVTNAIFDKVCARGAIFRYTNLELLKSHINAKFTDAKWTKHYILLTGRGEIIGTDRHITLTNKANTLKNAENLFHQFKKKLLLPFYQEKNKNKKNKKK